MVVVVIFSNFLITLFSGTIYCSPKRVLIRWGRLNLRKGVQSQSGSVSFEVRSFSKWKYIFCSIREEGPGMHAPVDENFVPGPPTLEIAYLMSMNSMSHGKCDRWYPKSLLMKRREYQPFHGAGPPNPVAVCGKTICEGGWCPHMADLAPKM